MSTFNLNITADSLARQVGVADNGQDEVSDEARNVALKGYVSFSFISPAYVLTSFVSVGSIAVQTTCGAD